MSRFYGSLCKHEHESDLPSSLVCVGVNGHLTTSRYVGLLKVDSSLLQILQRVEVCMCQN